MSSRLWLRLGINSTRRVTGAALSSVHHTQRGLHTSLYEADLKSVYGSEWRSKIRPHEQQKLAKIDARRARWLERMKEEHGPGKWEAAVAEAEAGAKATAEGAQLARSKKDKRTFTTKRMAFWTPEEVKAHEAKFAALAEVMKRHGQTYNPAEVPGEVWAVHGKEIAELRAHLLEKK